MGVEPPAALSAAAREFGTPLYVTHLDALAHDAAELEAAVPASWMLNYSLKANHLPQVVSRLATRGWGANVVSVGEWRQAARAGLPNERITFEGIGKGDDQLEQIINTAAEGTPLCWTAVESPEEAEAIVGLGEAAGLGKDEVPGIDLLLRVNPQVEPMTHDGMAVGRADSKFGMLPEEIRRLVQRGLLESDAVNLRGLHVHVGSQLLDVDAWVDGAVRVCDLLSNLDPTQTRLDTVDLGGGFPAGLPEPRIADFADRLTAALAAAGLSLPPRVAVEPGRFPVASAGWIVATVLHVRDRSGIQQAVLDAGMTELIRPAMYGARHPAHALATVNPPGGELVPTRLEGPVCESVDVVGTYLLPRLGRGDLVGIGMTGAYASSQSSHYNGRDRAPEVLIEDDGRLTLARAREQLR